MDKFWKSSKGAKSPIMKGTYWRQYPGRKQYMSHIYMLHPVSFELLNKGNRRGEGVHTMTDIKSL